MAEAILFSLAQNLIQTLASEALQAAASIWAFRSDLQRLKATTNAINNVILDAEDRQAEEHAVQDWLKRLKAVLYIADDLFDEYATLASRKTITTGNKCSKEVRLFFSKYNQIYLAIKVSRQIKKIRSELDDIENDGGRYSFRVRYNEPPVTTRRRDDEHSYIHEDEVIGREHDKEAIMRMLLDPAETTLAQVVYNDEAVRNEFHVRLWICASEEFDIKVIIQKILKSATNTSPDNQDLDQLQSKLRQVVCDKKYLLVLDDVWNESREEWLKLRRLLVGCDKGSKILVTTRSHIVADIMKDGIPRYDLKGLSAEKSWSLFEKLAFKHRQEQQSPSLVKIGKEIVEKCGNVPLAIRALASYLYDREEEVWLAVKDKELGGIGGQVDATMEVLKLSYSHLWSPLKQCFAYCSVFPKDYYFKKEELVRLWIAQGFVFPSSLGQSLEDAGHDYFMRLLERCFFQDVDRDRLGNILSCKMHDLIHDLAQRVAGEETTCIESGSRNPDQGVHHLCFCPSSASNESMSSLSSLRSLRTLLFGGDQGYETVVVSDSFFDGLFSSLKRLRVLEIRWIEIQTVPSSVCKLLHLRYLSLDYLPIKSLPASVQEIPNLQTLSVTRCNNLTEVPAGVEKLTSLRLLDLRGNYSLVNIAADISKLTNLRHLDLSLCPKLTHVAADISTLTNLTFLDLRGFGSLDHMPSGVENLTKLRRLWGFLAGSIGSSLAAINHLTALEGLLIYFREEAYSDQLETVRWDALNRLRVLYFGKVYGMSTLPVGLWHLTTLRVLRVLCPDLIELPEWIHCLLSLEILKLFECPKLKCLPEENPLLPRLKELWIIGCPLVKERCKPDGEDWPKIQHIPKVKIG
ncbi:putative disease resistance protein RGA4 [Drosera capensis]